MRRRPERGQSGAEYLGALILVAAITAAVMTVGVPESVGNGIDGAACRITSLISGGSCDSDPSSATSDPTEPGGSSTDQGPAGPDRTEADPDPPRTAQSQTDDDAPGGSSLLDDILGIPTTSSSYCDPPWADGRPPVPCAPVDSSDTSEGDEPAEDELPDIPDNGYQYTYEFEGHATSIWSPADVAAFARGRCEDLFPIKGCENGFQVGDRLNLEIKPAILGRGPYTQSFPVEVVAITDTGWSFEALEGHPEGAGRLINFEFVVTDDGTTALQVTAGGDGSALTNWPGLSDLNNLVADDTWDSFASNIDANFNFEYGPVVDDAESSGELV